jgi:integrase
MDLRKTFNAHKGVEVRRTLAEVITRYEREEMPERYSTSRGYRNLHRNHIAPKWGNAALDELDALAVREWINGLDCSTRSRGHIHAQMRVLCKFAMLWKWTSWPANPMSLFSISGATKRTRKPRTISPKQFFKILRNQSDIRFRAMLIGAGCLGLRASELFALQWMDFDFLGGKLMIQRAIVDGRVGETKTHGSEASIPLPKFAADAFLALYGITEFKKQDSWVFASPFQGGDMPFNSQHIQYNVLRGAGKAVGLDFNLGWHTFRHSFKNILKASGADPEMMRDMLRHSDTHTTMNVYGEADFERMREASDKAMEFILREE